MPSNKDLSQLKRIQIKKAINFILLGIVFLFVSRHIYENWDSALQVNIFRPLWFFTASLLAAVVLFLLPLSLHTLLQGFGVHLGYMNALYLFFVPMLGKYVPGKIWAMVAAVYLYEKKGIPRHLALKCILSHLFLGGLAALIMAFSLGGIPGIPINGFWRIGTLFASILGCALVFHFLPAITSAHKSLGFLNFSLEVSPQNLIRTIALFLVAFYLYGTAFYFLVMSLSYVSANRYFYIVGLFSFAQVAGLVAIFAPSGIGVREGVFIFGLQPIVGAGPAILIAGICRLWQTALELGITGLAWVWEHRGN